MEVLRKRLHDEFDEFRADLLLKDKEDILNYAYEYTTKRDFVEYVDQFVVYHNDGYNDDDNDLNNFVDDETIDNCEINLLDMMFEDWCDCESFNTWNDIHYVLISLTRYLSIIKENR
jgi:hypothetical protein